MKTRKERLERLLINLCDKKIHLMHTLEELLGDDNMFLVYELLWTNQKINDLNFDDEEIEVLD